MKRNSGQWSTAAYIVSMAVVMLGYVYYDPFQIDGDAVSYMDIASAILHRRWHDTVNGLWNPAYPALLALGKLLTGADRMHELQVFYWVNYILFLTSIACTAFFVHSLLLFRSRENNGAQDGTDWVLPDRILYLASYAIVFLSWEYEFSPGKIRVDGLFASLLLLGFGFLLRIQWSSSAFPAIGAGIFLGLDYWVKSPGLVISLIAFCCFGIYFLVQSRLKTTVWKLILAMAVFTAVVAPYIGALSLQKGRLDVGDSARLNYAWLVSGTEPLHLLNNQPARFGHSSVHLIHPQIELLSNPIVVSFAHFPNATYGPWFDPSYSNEGIVPHFSLLLQVRLALSQARHVWLFSESHGLVLALLLFAFACGSTIPSAKAIRGILFLFYFVLLFCFVMYLSVHLLDRYVAGMFWLASIATLAFFTTKNESKRKMVEGAAIFLAIAIPLVGLQTVAQLRQAAAFSGVHRGWQRTEEFDAAKALGNAGIAPGSVVACFRACNTGAYWARLADVHVTSEIFDPRYMTDMGNGAEMWRQLPNRASVLSVLAATGAKGLVGYFEMAPVAGEGWRPLAGNYYWMPLGPDKPHLEPENVRG